MNLFHRSYSPSLLCQLHELEDQIYPRMKAALAIHDEWEESHNEIDYVRYLDRMKMIEPLRDKRDALQKKIDKLQKKRRYRS